jgi:eukaryotic translation initiation factor 2C
MVLDVLIRHLPSMTYATVGRSFFTPQDAKPLANGAEVWQGFYQSARPAVGMFLFLLDHLGLNPLDSHTIFHNTSTILTIIFKKIF